ncbi:hypothetical protein [Paenibacillus glacialis]|uniref:Uncharacterized protein n=1 Tax=Paenibacillus glacialis TaxID=494026 RepID=A0A168LRU0_9BACL|nr:hypothetical protein [Paenibacillus glacialis]OAB43764.1 hypothetical protein PGLA_08260 [Paenibacillus glacialis]
MILLMMHLKHIKESYLKIDFMKPNGFQVVSEASKETLLRKYWNVPDKQIQSSVVLMNEPSCI